jgi:aspartokinase
MNSERLNGSKVLKGVSVFALHCPPGPGKEPLALSTAVAGARINLPYVTVVRGGGGWLVALAVENADEETASHLLAGHRFGEIIYRCRRCAILSLFPHQGNPRVAAALFESFGRAGFPVQGMANSPSAISVILMEEDLERISRVLFRAFTFKTYRTPEEWSAAQKGKEALYKEVVASYQEKRPKVYGVSCWGDQRLVSALFHDPTLAPAAEFMNEAADSGVRLSLVTSCPSLSRGSIHLTYCLPGTFDQKQASPASTQESAAVFSMNGPHFGDRYGITSELLAALEKRGIELLALNCTVASITGAVPASHLDGAVEAIQGCFEVPTVFK